MQYLSNSLAFFTELEQKILKICVETQKTPNTKAILRKKKGARGIRLPDFRLLQSYGRIDQWNRIESPEINPHTYSQLIYDKGCKTIQWWKDSLFNNWCWENWTAPCKKVKLDHSLTNTIHKNKHKMD